MKSVVGAEEERQRAFEEIARLRNELEQERDYLREEVETTLHYGEIVGSSDALRRVLAQVEAVAYTNASVLITGETGVGKELIARSIHAASQRFSGPLVSRHRLPGPRSRAALTDAGTGRGTRGLRLAGQHP